MYGTQRAIVISQLTIELNLNAGQQLLITSRNISYEGDVSDRCPLLIARELLRGDLYSATKYILQTG